MSLNTRKRTIPPVESLQPFTDVELLKLKFAQLYVFPKPEKNLTPWQRTIGELCREVQSVSNFSPRATPVVTRNTLTIGTISNPYEIFQVSPVLSSGDGSWGECLQTWRNQGTQISAMSTQSLLTKEDKEKSSNIPNAPRFMAVNHLPGKSLAAFKRQGLGKVSGKSSNVMENNEKTTRLSIEKSRAYSWPRIRIRMVYCSKVI